MSARRRFPEDQHLVNPAHELAHEITPERRRRLLVITYHFPPDGAVGGLRWSGLSKYLARLGWEVHVVTAAEPRGEVAVPGVHRHHRIRRRTLNDVYNSLAAPVRRRRGVAATGPAAPAVQHSPRVTPTLFGRLRTAAGLALSFPDAGRGWVWRAGSTARALLKAETFDAVITSGPPHTAHFAGMVATFGTGIPHLIDMRDPWRGTGPDWCGYPIKSRFIHTLVGLFESFAFRSARHVIVNTREFADALERARPNLAVDQISNGTDTELLPRRTPDLFDGVSIAYAGTIYLGRSFSTLLSALESVVRDRPDDAARITVRIAGSITEAQREQFRAELATRGLEGMVQLCGVLSRSEALTLLRRSHLALVLAQAQPTQIPAKLYECVGIGVPTLVVSEASSAATREARRIGGLVLEPDDVAGMRRVLDDLLDARVSATIMPTAPISYESLAKQLDRILRLAVP
ncbi:MAG TPA: glycosyltransferase [Gemmatimonadaceae bacterium]|nr:glycosyltransferase [Gemmatimonadaceae bacterium]